MILVDTNVFVYAADASSPFHSICNRWIERQRENDAPWHTTWPIVYEILRVTTHPGVLRKPWRPLSVLQLVQGLIETPGFSILTPTPRHVDVLRDTLDDTPGAAGNIMHDLHTVVLMREHGIRRIATRDQDFNRFRNLDVIDPVSARS